MMNKVAKLVVLASFLLLAPGLFAAPPAPAEPTPAAAAVAAADPAPAVAEALGEALFASDFCAQRCNAWFNRCVFHCYGEPSCIWACEDDYGSCLAEC